MELYAPGQSQPLDVRAAGAITIDRAKSGRTRTWVFALVGLALLIVLPQGSLLGWAAALAVALAALSFSRGVNPAVPRAEAFPETRTVELLREHIGDGRFFAEPGVLPPSTGLVHGLRALDGYDGLDPASYNVYRYYGIKPGLHPLLGWHTRGVQLDYPAFRLLGVTALALAEPLEDPAFELVGGPGHPSSPAECWVYRARDPFPRAFIAPHVVSTLELDAVLQEDPYAWNPHSIAAIREDWRPTEPLVEAEVTNLEFVSNTRVRLDARLEGDGLLVLTEQWFPGWRALVDGEEVPLFAADGIFRGVPLSSGEHEVVFEYHPTSVRQGVIASLLGLVATGALFALSLLRRRATSKA